MPKVYKFRPVGDCLSFMRAKHILESGNFWCSTLWELNDPMEGVYVYLRGQGEEQQLKDIFTAKNKYRICSFSGPSALEKPTMWGYYANGFRGIAIEVEVDVDGKAVRKVTYSDHPAVKPQTIGTESMGRLLTTKLSQWSTECEYRYLTKRSSPCQMIGKITGVYFGDPYCGVTNIADIVTNSKPQREYLDFKRQLHEIARSREYSCLSAGVTESSAGEWKVKCRPFTGEL